MSTSTVIKKISVLSGLLVFWQPVLSLLNQPAMAFKLSQEGHLGITTDAVRSIAVDIDGKTLKFSNKAIDKIIAANKETDSFIFPNNQAKAEFHFDDESFLAATTRLMSLKQTVIDNITKAQPDGSAAREALGGALHTIQDFYAHTNWVELGNTTIDNRLGRTTFTGLAITTPTSPPDNSGTLLPGGNSGTLLPGLTDLTSGWFKIPLCVPPAGKTRHGVPIVCPDGLNKDDSSRPGFPMARELAVKASQDFLNQILETPGIKNEVKPIQSLMGLKGTLGFIIDTTGSMQPVINQVKNQTVKIVNSISDTSEIPDFLLQTFNDPFVDTPFTTQNPKELVAAVNNLNAFGGGDCPELSMTGALRAVQASLPNSKLFLFTDASAKDGNLSGQVASEAAAKNTQISFLLNGSCSPIDPAYIEVARQTGGQVFSLNTSEISSAFDLIKPYVSGNLGSVVAAQGILDGDSKTFDVPIDSTVNNAIFSVSTLPSVSLLRLSGIEVQPNAQEFQLDAQNLAISEFSSISKFTSGLASVSLLSPSGVEVKPGDSNVTITELSSGSIITINSPDAGIWKLKIEGSGEFSVGVQADSPIQLDNFEVVERGINSVHGGLFPINEQLVANTTLTGLAKLFGLFKTADFSLISEAGDKIQSINLLPGDPEATDYEFVGELQIPTSPFRIAVNGLDVNDKPYQRVLPQIFTASTIKTTPEPTSIFSLLIFGSFGASLAFKRQLDKRQPEQKPNR